MEEKMLKKSVLIVAVLLFSASSVYAQDNTFFRFGVGGAVFNRGPTPSRGEIHFHEAGITANFALGHSTEHFRVMALFDPAIADGVRGTSIISGGIKGEVKVPFIEWLQLGGGAIYSYNHAKRADDIDVFEQGGLDTVFSPFLSMTYLERSRDGIFIDVRIGKSYGGDVIQPQTGLPVARGYVSVSIGKVFFN